MRHTHHCLVCGTGYEFCDSCRNVRGYTPWRTIVCTPECYQIHLLIGRCRRHDANEDDYESLRRLSATIRMKPEVVEVVAQLLEEHQ